MEDKDGSYRDLVQLARLAMAGRPQDVQMFIRRLAKRYQAKLPQVADELGALLREAPTRSSPLRGVAAAPLPVDLESRLQLIRAEMVPTLDVKPIWHAPVATALAQIIAERSREAELEKEGLSPTRTILFTGPPGVGKTLAAQWLARELKRPLLILDLAAVMSSFLGRTGSNVRHVLDYAKSVHCVLLLDELDAIAKRRDDVTDVGELKRLVTVLLQEIDDWPSSGLLVAATNHAELLDPAVWRRFEMKVAFPMPGDEEVRQAVDAFLDSSSMATPWRDALAVAFRGLSFSDIERELSLARRNAVVHSVPLEKAISDVLQRRVDPLSRQERGRMALWLTEAGISQRQVHALTGVSRDTIRKEVKRREVEVGDEDASSDER
jgi:SpoVK/Ycf46/Vps4 family AAA+-type ATPase